jgi:hypothetical protein
MVRCFPKQVNIDGLLVRFSSNNDSSPGSETIFNLAYRVIIYVFIYSVYFIKTSIN